MRRESYVLLLSISGCTFNGVSPIRRNTMLLYESTVCCNEVDEPHWYNSVGMMRWDVIGVGATDFGNSG